MASVGRTEALISVEISCFFYILFFHPGAVSDSMQPHYIPVTVFSWSDLFLDPISLAWCFRGSAMTSHKKLIDVTASVDRNSRSFTKEKLY